MKYIFHDTEWLAYEKDAINFCDWGKAVLSDLITIKSYRVNFMPLGKKKTQNSKCQNESKCQNNLLLEDQQNLMLSAVYWLSKWEKIMISVLEIQVNPILCKIQF